MSRLVVGGAVLVAVASSWLGGCAPIDPESESAAAKRAVTFDGQKRPVRHLAAGVYFTLALLDGEPVGGGTNGHAGCRATESHLWSWGAKSSLGRVVDKTFDATPAAVPGVALDPSGEIVSWRSVGAGRFHACAVADWSVGGLWCWGYNGQGQLGLGTVIDSTAPTRVPALVGKRITAVAAGGSHTCAAVDGSEGGLWCWGDNHLGQLGRFTEIDQSDGTPAPVPALVGKRITAVAAGVSHTCAAVDGSEGGLWCWGDNGQGQLGLGTVIDSTAPTRVPALVGKRITAVAAGGSHTCAAVDGEEGGLWCWGDNHLGQLGRFTEIDQSDGTPAPVPALVGKRIAAVAAGRSHTCAVVKGQACGLWCWGENSSGQLGRWAGGTEAHWTPEQVDYFSDKNIDLLVAGANHTCAAVSSGPTPEGPWCWGSNAFGQLGLGDTKERLAPNHTAREARDCRLTVTSRLEGDGACIITAEAHCKKARTIHVSASLSGDPNELGFLFNNSTKPALATCRDLKTCKATMTAEPIAHMVIESKHCKGQAEARFRANDGDFDTPVFADETPSAGSW